MNATAAANVITFHKFMREDLMKGLEKGTTPPFRALIAGGYGLKSLLEEKYKLDGAVSTSDFDITVSNNGCTMSSMEVLQHFSNRVLQFIDTQDRPYDYKLITVHQGNQVARDLGYRRYAVLMLKYKKKDFVDIALTDMVVPLSMYDRATSKKLGLPLKTLEMYLQDLLTIIYFENVPGVYPELYAKRNPVQGWEQDKGQKDFDRTNIACRVLKDNKYAKYCKLVKDITVSELKNMDDEQKQKYFESLQVLVTLRAKQYSTASRSSYKA